MLDSGWTTRSAHVVGRSCSGAHEVRLEADGAGGWTIDGAPAPELAGCLDVDLEASAFTNTLPVNRLRLGVGERAEAPAAYVRAVDLRVERLEQRYARVEDDGAGSRYDYEAPDLQFACRIVYDRFGLVLDYPGIAVRVM
ncbi:MAG: putative glycolipid-binding domain-containing protein [Gaiellaceae bacterium]